MSKIKQAVLLAAGESSRFQPISAYRHKAEIPLLGETLLSRTVESLVGCGLKEIIIVHPSHSKPQIKKQSSCSIKFTTQTEPKGMGNALLSVADVLDDVFIVLHAYHLDCDRFLPSMMRKIKGKDAILLLKKPIKGKIGIAEYVNNKIVSVKEIPYQGEKNYYSISGTYILNRKYIEILKQQKDHHYNFESALDDFAKTNRVGAHTIDYEVLTLKYPWHLFGVRDYLFEKASPFIHPSFQINTTAVLEGQVLVAEGAKIGSFAVLKGPVYIGKNVFVGDFAFIRAGTVLEEDAVVGAYSEVKDSIVLEKTHVHGYVADSVVGRKVQIGHGTITANRRFDRSIICVKVKEKDVETGRTFLGAIIGDKAALGIGVRTMPGIIIGENSIVGPGTVVFENIPPNSRYYTRYLSKPKTKNQKPKTQT